MVDASNALHTVIARDMDAKSGARRSKRKKSNKPKRENDFRELLPPDLRQELREIYEKTYRPEDGRALIEKFQIDWGDRFKEVDPEPPGDDTVRKFFYKEEQTTFEYWVINGLCLLLLDCSLEDWKGKHKQPEDTVSEQNQECFLPEESTEREPTLTNITQMSVASPLRASSDWWTKVCRERLHAQEQQRLTTNQLTFKDGMAYELDDIPLNLGLVERKKAPKICDEISPERCIQPSEYEIGKKFKYSEFLDQVLSTQQQGNATKKTRIALTGEPGAGKTTLLQKIAFEVDKNGGLPIVVFLRDLRGRNLRQYLLKDWLVDAVPRRITQDVEDDFVEQFNQGRVWLLLDGVDEMATGSVSALDDLKQQLASSFVARARVVLTCRLNVWDNNLNALETFETYRTLEVSYPEQVGQFIDSWFKKIDPERGQRLKTALAQPEKERIQDLVKNPLRLALLCRTWQREEGDLPGTKAKLYQQFVDDLYWWKWKYEGFRTTDPQRQELKAKLGQLARDAIAQDSSRFRLLESSIYPLLGNRHEEESLFSQACKLGLLIHIGIAAEDTAKSVYAFFHPTFQEYFAACAIPNWEYFLKHVPHNPTQGTYRIFEQQWKEVILLWLGQDDVPKQQKEDFIATLVHFEDGCWEFYWYRAFFIAAAGIAEFRDCIGADWIVANLVEYATEHDPPTGADRVVNPAIWATLLETDRTRAINALIDVLNSDFLDDDSRWKVFNLLEKIGTGNLEVVAGLTKLIDNSTDDEELQQNAAFFLGRIDPGNQKAINLLTQQLLKKTLPDWLDWLPRRAAYFLGTIDQPNQDAINYLTNWIKQNEEYRLETASNLGRIDPSNPVAIKTLTELLKIDRGDRVMNIPLIAARDLLEIDPENPEAISFLREFIKSGRFLFLWERLEAASTLGKTQQYKQEAIQVICEIINEIIQTGKGKEPQLLEKALESWKQIESSSLYSFFSKQQETFLSRGINVNLENENGWICMLAVTKHCLEKEDYLENSCYKDIWFCAQVLNYPDFYGAWHSRVSSTRTEAGEDITVIAFNTVQTSVQALENQLINISSKVQPTDKTYLITLDTQSLKLETNTSAIAQKLCTKIYHKTGDFEIPTVSDAAQLQQYIPRIQEKLQKPNLALILHGCEPNEHLLNFCYSLADPDIGLDIGLITSKPLEQPLKGFLPNQDNLLSAIQSWVDEIG